jgi:hypothetical protein
LEDQHWYERVQESVETSHEGKVTILRNQVNTDGTIPNNKPYIIIWNSEERTCMLLDVAILGDRNMIKKEAEKILSVNTLQYKYSACGT